MYQILTQNIELIRNQLLSQEFLSKQLPILNICICDYLMFVSYVSYYNS